MKFSVSLKKNHEFKRLYTKGKSAASAYVAIYCRRNNTAVNRLGITVSTKLGSAVCRNRIRRRYREIYRLNEEKLTPGYDIVAVARAKSKDAAFSVLEADFLNLCRKLGIAKSLS